MQSSDSSNAKIDKSFFDRDISILNPKVPVTVSLDDTLETAVTKLQECRIGCVLVCNAKGQLVGILTERDILFKTALKDDVESDRPVSDFMTANPNTAERSASIAHVLQMMALGGYRHMPILNEEGMPVGVLSVKDIVDYIVESMLV